MALVNPNIAMGYRGIELPNQLGQFAQLSQIQNAQNQNSLAQYQLGAAQRAEAKDIARTNALAGAGTDEGAIASALLKAGDITGYSNFLKNQQERKTAALTEKNVQSQIGERDFKLAKDKMKFGWESIGEATTPQAAIEALSNGVSKGYFDMKTASAEIQKLQNMPIEQYKQYRLEKVMGLLDAKDKLGFMLPKVERQEAGGQIISIQANPAMAGYGLPVQGMTPIAKTATIAEQTGQKQLGVSQGTLKLAQERFAFDKTNDGQSVTYQQDVNGNIVALPTKVRPGDVPRGRSVVAPGEGMTPMAGKPSEAAAKETASLNQQNAIVAGALDAIKKNPDAFGTARGVAGGVLGETFGSRAVGETPEETQARSFLFNVVSGVIKERAGTAQSAGEQATLNRFLPTTTDNADELTAKLKGFQNYLTARESAGKKPGGANPPALSGIDQQALQWANSNPADPRAAAIKQRLGR